MENDKYQRLFVTVHSAKACPCHANISLPYAHPNHWKLFSEETINERWTINYSADINLPLNTPPQISVSNQHTPKKRVMNETEKFRQCNQLLQKVSAIVSQFVMEQFNKRMKQFDNLLDLVREGKDFIVAESLDVQLDDSESLDVQLDDSEPTTSNQDRYSSQLPSLTQMQTPIERDEDMSLPDIHDDIEVATQGVCEVP